MDIIRVISIGFYIIDVLLTPLLYFDVGEFQPKYNRILLMASYGCNIFMIPLHFI